MWHLRAESNHICFKKYFVHYADYDVMIGQQGCALTCEITNFHLDTTTSRADRPLLRFSLDHLQGQKPNVPKRRGKRIPKRRW